MKLLVFAHTPPPHHGQSYMVQVMLDGLGGDRRVSPGHPTAHGIECYHVNARVSRDAEDIGGLRLGKLGRLLGFCLEAIWCRFRHGVKTMYYVPAPGKRSAVLRDWMVMFLCRPFFPKLILHWHAAGLAPWLDSEAGSLTRALTRRALRHADLSIVLSDFNRADANYFLPKAVAVVRIGIPDPCPRFAEEILPHRDRRVAARRELLARDPASEPNFVEVVYLAHGLREKGLFEALEGVLLANADLDKERSPFRFNLTVIGAFFSEAVRAEFEARIAQAQAGQDVRCLGFVSTEEKKQRLAEADLFCFPTYYSAENQPGNLIEAMAFGLPCVTTKWRSIPEMLPEGYPALVDAKSPRQVADALRSLITENPSRSLREHFLRHFTLEQHLQGMAAAIRSVEKP